MSRKGSLTLVRNLPSGGVMMKILDNHKTELKLSAMSNANDRNNGVNGAGTNGEGSS